MKVKSLVLCLFLIIQSVIPARAILPALDSRLPQASVPAPVIKWKHAGCSAGACETGWYASPAAADFNGDSKVEVVSAGKSISLIEGDTGVIISTFATNNRRIWSGVVVADVQPDGQPEIAVSDDGGLVSLYDHNGSLVWWNNFNEIEAPGLAASDLDGDGSLEIIAASLKNYSQWTVYRADGSTYPSAWPQLPDDPDHPLGGCFNQNLAAGDLNQDGFEEILGPNNSTFIAAFSHNGDQLPASSIFRTNITGTNKYWSQVGTRLAYAAELGGATDCASEPRANFKYSAPILVDLDGSGDLEAVIIGNVYTCTLPYTNLYQIPFIMNADRTRWKAGWFDWTSLPTADSHSAPLSEDTSKIESAMPNPAAADLDGDGNLEILFPSYDGRLHAYWLDKTEHGSWPFAVSQPAEGILRFASEPVVADLNADGKGEVIFADWTQKSSYQTGRLYILDYQGNQLQAVDLPMPLGADWNGSLAAPTLADIDGDQEIEILLNTAHSGVVAYDLPGVSAARIFWGTGRGSYQRSGMARGDLSSAQTWVLPRNPRSGSTLTYQIKLRNPGLLLQSVTLTDTLSAGQAFSGGLAASSGSATASGSVIYWSGKVGTVPVTVTFQAQVDEAITETRILTSTVLINDHLGPLLFRQTSVLVNGHTLFLPLTIH